MDIEHVEAAAKKLLEGRMASVRHLSETRAHVVQLRAALAEAERDDVKAFRAALSAGWKAEELKSVGFDEPDKKRRARKRASSSPSTPAQHPSDSTTTEDLDHSTSQFHSQDV